MKDFFEDLGKRIGETAETMTNKAGDMIEIQRLKGQARELARGNAVDLMELGKTIYDRYKAGEELEESAKRLCEAIKDREQNIREYEKKIARIKGSSECTSCGKMVAEGMSYCPYCGEKMRAAEEAAKKAGEMAEKAAEKTSEFAGKAAEKTGEFAEKAAEKTGEFAGKAAEKTGEFAEKAAEKTGEFAERAADKAEEFAEKAAEKLNSAADKLRQ